MALRAAVREYVDSWEAVDGVGAVDDPPFFGEVVVSEHATEFVGVPAPGWSYGVIERGCRAGEIGRLRRDQYGRFGTQLTGPQPEYFAYLIRRDVYSG